VRMLWVCRTESWGERFPSGRKKRKKLNATESRGAPSKEHQRERNFVRSRARGDLAAADARGGRSCLLLSGRRKRWVAELGEGQDAEEHAGAGAGGEGEGSLENVFAVRDALRRGGNVGGGGGVEIEERVAKAETYERCRRLRRSRGRGNKGLRSRLGV